MPRAGERTFLGRLASNTAIGFVGNAAQRGLAFAITLVLARGLGGDGFGLYSYVVSYMFLFAFFADLGIERVVTREVSRTPQFAGELLGSALVVKLGLSLLAMSAAVGSAVVIGMSGDAFYCILLAAVGLPMSVEHVFRGYFQSRFQVAYTYAITLPATVWFLAAAVVVTAYRLPVYTLFAIGLLSAPLILLSLLWVSHYRLHLRLRPRGRRMRAMLRDSMELGGFIFLFMLSMRLDQVMLFHLRGDLEVGHYAVGVRLSEALALIPEALLMTLFPLLVSSETSAPERFHHTYRLGFKYLAAVSVFFAFALTLVRHEVVTLLFGPAYDAAAPSLAILAWNMFFGYVGVIYLSLFVAQSRHRLLLLVSAGALAVNIALNLLWIPPYGATGAATATLAANAVGFACWLGLRETRPYMLTCLQESWRCLLAAAVSAAVLWELGLGGVGAVVLLFVLYAGLLWALGGVLWSDVRLVQRLFAVHDPHAAH